MKNNHSDFLPMLESYFSTYLPDNLGASPNTIRSYKYTFQLLIKYLYSEKHISTDKIMFSGLNYDVLLSFLCWLEEERNCSVATRNQRLAALMSFSEYAQNRSFEAASVFRASLLKIPTKRQESKARSVFTVPEVKILLRMPNEHTNTGYRDKVLLSVLYASGARAQEICDLTVGDVQQGQNGLVLILNGKGKKVRRVGISGNCAKMLKQYISFRKLERKPIMHVFSSQTHEQMTVSCVEGIFKKYITEAKKLHPELFLQKSYSPHSMRHTTATHMLEAGVPLVVIKNMLGHSSLQTTQIYAQMSQNTVDQYLREWNEKWFSSNEALRRASGKNVLPDFLTVK